MCVACCWNLWKRADVHQDHGGMEVNRGNPSTRRLARARGKGGFRRWDWDSAVE